MSDIRKGGSWMEVNECATSFRMSKRLMFRSGIHGLWWLVKGHHSHLLVRLSDIMSDLTVRLSDCTW